MDILDRALHLPLRRPLPDLSLGLGLVPEPGARGSWVWTCLLARVDKPLRDVGRRLLTVRLGVSGLTLDDYLREQEKRLRDTNPAVIAVKLYLRQPGRMLGYWTSAHLALPRAGMRRNEAVDYAHAVWAELTDRPELAGCDTRIVVNRREGTQRPRPRDRSPVKEYEGVGAESIRAQKRMSPIRDKGSRRVPNPNRLPGGRYAPAKC